MGFSFVDDNMNENIGVLISIISHKNSQELEEIPSILVMINMDRGVLISNF